MNAKLLAPFALLAAAAGCATYHARPLTGRAVDEALAPKSAEALRIEAARLAHPALPPTTINLADGLNPDEAAVLAVLANPGLRAERDRLALADAQLLQARLLPNPELSASRDAPVGGGADLVSAFSVGLGMTIDDLLTRRARKEGARADREAVALDVAWQEWQVAEAAKTALYAVVGAEAAERLEAEAEARMTESLALVRRAVEAGQLTAADLAEAESGAAEARAARLEAQAALADRRLDLTRLLGLPPGTAVAPEPGVALPTSVVPPPREELERGLEARRLDLLALRRGYDSAEAALRAAVIAQFPRLSIGANRARDTGDVTTNGVSFTLGLPVFDRNQAQVAAATATRAQLFDEYAARVFEARAELAAADERIRALDRRIEAARADEATFRHLEETYRDALARGQATALEYVQAWTNEQNARRRGLALQGELVEARVRLELAGGLYRVDGAAAPAAEPKGR